MASTKTARVMSLVLAFFLFLTSIVAVFLVFTQSGDDSTAQDDVTELIQQQQAELAANEETNSMPLGNLENFTPSSEPVGELQIIDTVVGTGAEVAAGATVSVHYSGAYVSNGEIFDSSVSRGQPAEFGLNEVIPGWTQGLVGMKVGGQRRLIIPGSLAYGEAPEGYTPGSTSYPMGPLVFDIELLDIK